MNAKRKGMGGTPPVNGTWTSYINTFEQYGYARIAPVISLGTHFLFAQVNEWTRNKRRNLLPLHRNFRRLLDLAEHDA